MQIKRQSFLLLLLIVPVGLSACGGGHSYTDSVADMASTITSFNQASVHDVASTGAACHDALQSLRSDDALAHPSGSGQEARTERALQYAYNLAIQGFTDCDRAAARMDYLGMARATAEIGFANGWIKRAHQFDQ